MQREEEMNKALQMLLYVVRRLGSPSMHTAFKTLYFAEQHHMAEYGLVLTGDDYIKMKYGPVPSKLYDLVKIVRGDSTIPVQIDFADELKSKIELNDNYITAKVEPELDYLSNSVVACLDWAIENYGKLKFNDLTELSHDSAWNAALINRPMDTIAIARAGKADDETITCLKESIENDNYFGI